MSRDDDVDELEFGKPLALGECPPTALEELNALFERGFTVPLALRMNSVCGKFATPEGYRSGNGDWVVPYPRQLTDHYARLSNARLLEAAEGEIRIIRGEARVI